MNQQQNQICPRIILGEIIGRGAFSTVHFGNIPETQTCVAIKCTEKKLVQSKIIYEEIQMLSMCCHIPAVVKFYFMLESVDVFFMVMEYCSGGDLFSRLEQGVTYYQSLEYIRKIANALFQIHNVGLIFHDLKPENICFDENDHIKFIDFELATIMDQSKYNPTTNRYEVITCGGTLEYSAPEVFLRVAHGYEADWWSFGVLAYELLCGKLPFQIEGSRQEQCDYICSPENEFHRNKLIPSGSVEESFVTIFLQKQQSKRFGYFQHQGIDEITGHPIFDQLVQ